MASNIENRPQNRLKAAIPLMTLASFFMALMATTVKIGASEFTAESMVFWRNLVSLVLLLPWLQFGPPRVSLHDKLKTKQWRLHLIRGITSFLTVYLYFYSLKFLDLTSATLLFNTIPIFVPIIGFIWLGIAIEHRLWWAIGLAFLGIALILQPGTQIFQLASVLALLSGVTGAVTLVALRFGHYSEPSVRMLFYLFVISMICPGLMSLFSFEASWEHLQISDLKLLALVGIFGFLYQISMTAAIKFAPITLLGPFLYIAVIFTMILDKMIWHTTFPTITLIGCACIIAGAFLMLILYPKKDLKIKRE